MGHGVLRHIRYGRIPYTHAGSWSVGTPRRPVQDIYFPAPIAPVAYPYRTGAPYRGSSLLLCPGPIGAPALYRTKLFIEL